MESRVAIVVGEVEACHGDGVKDIVKYSEETKIIPEE